MLNRAFFHVKQVKTFNSDSSYFDALQMGK